MTSNAPDLTRQPPRSPRVRLGGYVILPRLLDKGRATLAGRDGEYCYNCPLDQRFFEFVGLDAESLKPQFATGKGDWEILEWINTKARHRRTPAEIAAWSAHQEQPGPADMESRQFFNESQAKLAPRRADIATWFDLLDLDDYVSFGGRP